MSEELIAPCGMNCGLCSSYLAMKHDLKKKGFGRTYCAGSAYQAARIVTIKGSVNCLRKDLCGFAMIARISPAAIQGHSISGIVPFIT